MKSQTIHPSGWIEVTTGPMFSGKSSLLILRISQANAVGRKVQAFKPLAPTHTAIDKIHSRIGLSIAALPIQEPRDILDLINPATKVIAIDEGHFFDNRLVDVCRLLSSKGKQVIVAGVDIDFRGEPFGSITQLIAVAQIVIRLSALCAICGHPATFTQRLINGDPARYTDPVIIPGDENIYEPRCKHHHKVIVDATHDGI